MVVWCFELMVETNVDIQKQNNVNFIKIKKTYFQFQKSM